MISAGAWHSLPHVCPCWYRRCSMWRAAMQRTWVRLLRTQPHSCRRCCRVWPCGWHGMLLCTQPPPVAHCGLTALYAMLYVGADHAGPLHTQALGEWPLRHYQTLFHSRWKPPLLGINGALQISELALAFC